MGIVYTEITLKNAIDVGNCDRGLITEQEIRQMTIQVIVDTGARTLVINEEVRQALGLELKGTKDARLANNAIETVALADPVEVHWKNREMTCRPWVVSGAGEVLLGAIPLEDMDLIVDPANLAVIGAHGDKEMGILCSCAPGNQDSSFTFEAAP